MRNAELLARLQQAGASGQDFFEVMAGFQIPTSLPVLNASTNEVELGASFNMTFGQLYYKLLPYMALGSTAMPTGSLKTAVASDVAAYPLLTAGDTYTVLQFQEAVATASLPGGIFNDRFGSVDPFWLTFRAQVRNQTVIPTITWDTYILSGRYDAAVPTPAAVVSASQRTIVVGNAGAASISTVEFDHILAWRQSVATLGVDPLSAANTPTATTIWEPGPIPATTLALSNTSQSKGILVIARTSSIAAGSSPALTIDCIPAGIGMMRAIATRVATALQNDPEGELFV